MTINPLFEIGLASLAQFLLIRYRPSNMSMSRFKLAFSSRDNFKSLPRTYSIQGISLVMLLMVSLFATSFNKVKNSGNSFSQSVLHLDCKGKFAFNSINSFRVDHKSQNEMIPYFEVEEEEDENLFKRHLLKRPLIFISSVSNNLIIDSLHNPAAFDAVYASLRMPDSYMEFIQVSRI